LGGPAVLAGLSQPQYAKTSMIRAEQRIIKGDWIAIQSVRGFPIAIILVSSEAPGATHVSRRNFREAP